MTVRVASLRGAAAFVAGLVFAVGLGIAGMTRPSKVIAFLDVTGRWDPSLALVMGGAVAVGLAGFAVVFRRGSPLLAPAFVLPRRHETDRSLLLGSAIFGAGWGLAGVCPGPALVALLSGAPALVVFVAAMATGFLAEAGLAWKGAEAAQPSTEIPPETTCG